MRFQHTTEVCVADDRSNCCRLSRTFCSSLIQCCRYFSSIVVCCRPKNFFHELWLTLECNSDSWCCSSCRTTFSMNLLASSHCCLSEIFRSCKACVWITLWKESGGRFPGRTATLTSESSALVSHWCRVRQASTTCVFKSSAIGSCEAFFSSRSIRFWNSSSRTRCPIATHRRGSSFSAHCCNFTSTVVLKPLTEEKVSPLSLKSEANHLPDGLSLRSC